MLTVQNHSIFFKWSNWACPSTTLFFSVFVLHSCFLQTKQTNKKKQGVELSSRPRSATFLSCIVQDRCSVFQPAKNKASSWLLYFKQERPPTAPNMPTERKNKWLSSSPDTYAQSISVRRNCLERNIPIPPRCCHRMGLGASAPTCRGEWHRECSGTVGNHKSPLQEQEQGSIQQARAIQMSKKVIWEGFNTGMPALLLHKKAKVSSALLACGHNIQ